MSHRFSWFGKSSLDDVASSGCSDQPAASPEGVADLIGQSGGLSPPVSPPARSGPSLAYHPATKTLVLFGGDSANGFLGDTWLWNGITWTAVPGDGPPARVGASMAFDPASGSLILFGGYGPLGSSNGAFDATWMWNGKSWVRLSPRTSPPGRNGTSLAYHSSMGRLILFGGKRSPMGVPEPEATWAWDGMDWSQLSLGRLPPWRSGAQHGSSGRRGAPVWWYLSRLGTFYWILSWRHLDARRHLVAGYPDAGSAAQGGCRSGP